MTRTELSHATSMADHHLERARANLRDVIDIFQAADHTHRTLDHNDSAENCTVDADGNEPDADDLLEEGADESDEDSARGTLTGAARRQFAKAATANGLTNDEFTTAIENLIAVEKHLMKSNRNIAELREIVEQHSGSEDAKACALRAAEDDFDVDDLIAVARLGIDDDTAVTANDVSSGHDATVPSEVVDEQMTVIEDHLSGVVTGGLPAVPEEVYETVVAAQGQLEKKHRRVREAFKAVNEK